jgi:F-type H+-transporting ATPase subunit b
MRFRLILAVAVAAFAIVVGPAAAAAEPAGHAEEECIHLLEDGGSIDDCQEAPSPILPETNEIVWGALSFAVLFVVLWRFALPPVRKMMGDRESRIRADLERAEAARTESEEQLAEYQRQLADARVEAGRIIEEARQSADQVRRDLLARAESDAAEVRARAQQDIRLATERATADLQNRVADLSIELAERVVEKNLDRETQIQLIENYINQVGSRGAT